MDPVAHTFFGAVLAQTGLKRLTPYATGTLIIGANIPDADAIVTFLGEDTSLYLRRGMTHGILAMAIWPLILSGLVFLWWRFRSGKPQDKPDPKWLLFLACIGTWSHPLLDWMNTYGVRLLMPFDGTWFYGDTLFIIDPWFWLMTAAGLVLAYSTSKRVIIGWTVLGFLMTVLVVGTPLVSLGVKIGWIIGVATILALRLYKPTQPRAQTVARIGLASLILYIGLVFGAARVLESSFENEGLIEAHAGPLPGTPFEKRVILVFKDRYELKEGEAEIVIKREEPDKIVQAALEAESIRGFSNWMRYPYWTVTPEAENNGWLVEFRDLRYVSPGEEPRGIGYAAVRLDKDLRPR